MKKRHFTLPPVFCKTITFENGEHPNLKVNYYLNNGIPDLLVVYAEKLSRENSGSPTRENSGSPSRENSGSPINEVLKWKPVTIISSEYQLVDNLFTQAVQVWNGTHERWNFNEGQQTQFNEYGAGLEVPKDGFEIFLDAMIPEIPNWQEDPQQWQIMAFPPTVAIQER